MKTNIGSDLWNIFVSNWVLALIICLEIIDFIQKGFPVPEIIETGK
jgi:hypothetical protein